MTPFTPLSLEDLDDAESVLVLPRRRLLLSPSFFSLRITMPEAAKRRALSVSQKLDIIAEVEKQENFAVIAARHKLCVSSIYNVIRLREETLLNALQTCEAVDRHAQLFAEGDESECPTEEQLNEFAAIPREDGQPCSIRDIADRFSLSPGKAYKIFKARRQHRQGPYAKPLVTKEEIAIAPPMMAAVVAPPPHAPLPAPVPQWTGQQVLAALNKIMEEEKREKNEKKRVAHQQPEMTPQDPHFVPLTTSLWNFKCKLPTVCADY